jgi:hypothetical protein
VDAGIEREMIAENRSRAGCRRHDGRQLRGDRARGAAGLGSHVQWDRKLDGRLAQALMSIPAIKAVGIGRGPAVATVPGSRVHDEILPGNAKAAVPLRRPTNNAGGLEGGVTNGEDLRVTGYMKPISTLMKPLRSVDLATMTESPAAHRTQRRLRRSGSRRGRRSDGRDRPCRRRRRKIRRRFGRGDGGELAGLHQANPLRAFSARPNRTQRSLRPQK